MFMVLYSKLKIVFNMICYFLNFQKERNHKTQVSLAFLLCLFLSEFNFPRNIVEEMGF